MSAVQKKDSTAKLRLFSIRFDSLPGIKIRTHLGYQTQLRSLKPKSGYSLHQHIHKSPGAAYKLGFEGPIKFLIETPTESDLGRSSSDAVILIVRAQALPKRRWAP